MRSVRCVETGWWRDGHGHPRRAEMAGRRAGGAGRRVPADARLAARAREPISCLLRQCLLRQEFRETKTRETRVMRQE